MKAQYFIAVLFSLLAFVDGFAGLPDEEDKRIAGISMPDLPRIYGESCQPMGPNGYHREEDPPRIYGGESSFPSCDSLRFGSEVEATHFF